MFLSLAFKVSFYGWLPQALGPEAEQNTVTAGVCLQGGWPHHGGKETKTWGKRQGVLQVPLSRVLLGRQHACFLYFTSYLLQFLASPRSPFSYKYIGGLTHPMIRASLKSATQIQTITWLFAMYSNIFLNGLYALVLYLFYICFEENLRFLFDVISFVFSSTNPCFTSDKNFSILRVLESWLSG